MKINGVKEFNNFVVASGFTNLSPELSSMCSCITEYDRLCSCDSPEVQKAKLNQCKTFYLQFASNANNYKSQLLSKTSDGVIIFFNDGKQINSVRR